MWCHYDGVNQELGFLSRRPAFGSHLRRLMDWCSIALYSKTYGLGVLSYSIMALINLSFLLISFKCFTGTDTTVWLPRCQRNVGKVGLFQITTEHDNATHVYHYWTVLCLLRWDRIHGNCAYTLWLTHWGRVTHICVSKLTIIGSDNGLSPDRRQAIIWTNAGLLSIGPLGTNFSEILIEILKFSFKKMHLKVSSAKRQPFCPGLNVLTNEATAK